VSKKSINFLTFVEVRLLQITTINFKKMTKEISKPEDEIKDESVANQNET